MQPDNLKQQWQNVNSSIKTQNELKSMMFEGRHPALKGMRRQVTIETVSSCVLLAVYYDIFDGDRKPFTVNLLLQIAIIVGIILGLIGYAMARRSVDDKNLIQSLQKKLANLKTYAIVAVAGRFFWAMSLLIFFASVVTFDSTRNWLLIAAVSGFAIQLFFLSKIWIRRIGQLRNTIQALAE
jgi:hypothetical protein